MPRSKIFNILLSGIMAATLSQSLHGSVRMELLGLPLALTDTLNISLINKTYVPSEATLRDGDSIRICNNDQFFHRPFSYSAFNRFGDPKAVQLRPGECMTRVLSNPTSQAITVKLFDEIHSYEKLTLTVLPRGDRGTTTRNGGPCFSADPGMASSNRSDHATWAREQDSSRLESNLRSKIDILFGCTSVSDDQLAIAFADLSFIIASRVRNACFNNDSGASSLDRNAHYGWAKTKPRSVLLENLKSKISMAFKCMSSDQQKEFFADSSVRIASTSTTATSDTTPVIDNGSLTGTWEGVGLGFTYEITQTGSTFAWKVTNDTDYREEAKGKILPPGNRLEATWTNKNGKDSGTGTIIFNENGRAIKIAWDNSANFVRK